MRPSRSLWVCRTMQNLCRKSSQKLLRRFCLSHRHKNRRKLTLQARSRNPRRPRTTLTLNLWPRLALKARSGRQKPPLPRRRASLSLNQHGNPKPRTRQRNKRTPPLHQWNRRNSSEIRPQLHLFQKQRSKGLPRRTRRLRPSRLSTGPSRSSIPTQPLLLGKQLPRQNFSRPPCLRIQICPNQQSSPPPKAPTLSRP